ncbi:MAG: GNAT family N-acetyltransferase [Terriglobales bacterium]
MTPPPKQEPALECRVLDAGDAAAYWQLRLESLEREPFAFTEAPAEHRQMTIAQTAERLRQHPGNPSFVVGAFVNGKLAGIAGFYRQTGEKTRHKGHVFGVYVAAEHRGKSIARQAMAELLRQTKRLPGLEQVDLSVAGTQPAAKKLYESLGFQVWGREPRAVKVGSKYVDEEWMVLRFDQGPLRGRI